MSGDETAARVQRAQAGDRQAMAWLIEAHQPELYRFLARRTGSSGEARDLLQDVLLAAVEKLHQLRKPDRFRAWLFAIARNRFKHRKSRTLVEVQEQDGCDDDRNTPLQLRRVLASERLARAREALAELSPKQRGVIELRLAGLSNDEVAQTMKTSVGAVKVHYSNGMKRLRGIL